MDGVNHSDYDTRSLFECVYVGERERERGREGVRVTWKRDGEMEACVCQCLK